MSYAPMNASPKVFAGRISRGRADEVWFLDPFAETLGTSRSVIDMTCRKFNQGPICIYINVFFHLNWICKDVNPMNCHFVRRKMKHVPKNELVQEWRLPLTYGNFDAE